MRPRRDERVTEGAVSGRASYPRDWSRCRACGAIYEMGAAHTHVEPPSRPLRRPVLRVIVGDGGDVTIDLREDPADR